MVNYLEILQQPVNCCGDVARLTTTYAAIIRNVKSSRVIRAHSHIRFSQLRIINQSKISITMSNQQVLDYRSSWSFSSSRSLFLLCFRDVRKSSLGYGRDLDPVVTIFKNLTKIIVTPSITNVESFAPIVHFVTEMPIKIIPPNSNIEGLSSLIYPARIPEDVPIFKTRRKFLVRVICNIVKYFQFRCVKDFFKNLVSFKDLTKLVKR